MSDLDSLMRNSAEGFRIVLVCGAERTGTTLLQRILCSDPTAIPVVGELPIINTIIDVVSSARENYDFFYSDYFINREELDSIADLTVRSIVRSIRRKHPESQLGVLKAPGFTPQLHTLRRILPKANFVVMTRSPMDAIASMEQVATREKTAGSAPAIAALAGNIKALTRHFLSYYEPLMSLNASDVSPITFVKYEDLVRRPEVEISRLSANLHLTLSSTNDRSEVMRSVYLHERSNARHQAYWSDLYQLDISAARVNSYKDVLTPDQQKIVLDMTRDYRRWRRRPWKKKENTDKM